MRIALTVNTVHNYPFSFLKVEYGRWALTSAGAGPLLSLWRRVGRVFSPGVMCTRVTARRAARVGIMLEHCVATVGYAACDVRAHTMVARNPCVSGVLGVMIMLI